MLQVDSFERKRIHLVRVSVNTNYAIIMTILRNFCLFYIFYIRTFLLFFVYNRQRFLSFRFLSEKFKSLPLTDRFLWLIDAYKFSINLKCLMGNELERLRLKLYYVTLQRQKVSIQKVSDLASIRYALSRHTQSQK